MSIVSRPVYIIAEKYNTPRVQSVDNRWDIASCPPGYYFQPLAILSPHVSGSGFIGTSCQSRDRVPLFMGFSIMLAWVTQPSSGYNSLRIGKFQDPGGDARYSGPSYGDPDLSFSSALASSSTPATSSSSPRVPITTGPNHVRV